MLRVLSSEDATNKLFKGILMKQFFSLNTPNTHTFYKAVISLLTLVFLSGCDICREPLEEQAKQHQLVLDKKQAQIVREKKQVSLLDEQLKDQKQSAQAHAEASETAHQSKQAELETAHQSKLAELETAYQSKQSELETLQQKSEKNQLDSNQTITQLEQKNKSVNEELSSVKLNLEQKTSDITELDNAKTKVTSELKALHETHQQVQQEQRELLKSYNTQQERLNLTQSILVERGLQLADLEKKVLAVTNERDQLQNELSNREVELPPMYESTDPKAQIELNVLYTHLVEEQKQQSWLKKQLLEIQGKNKQLQSEVTESQKKISINEEQAINWEEKQNQSVIKIDELNQQITEFQNTAKTNQVLVSSQQEKQQQLVNQVDELNQQLTEFKETASSNEALASTQKEKQQQLIVQMDELNHQLTTSSEQHNQTVKQLETNNTELKKQIESMQQVDEKNTRLLEQIQNLQAELKIVLGEKQATLLNRDSIEKQLSETKQKLKKTQVWLMEHKQLIDSSSKKLNTQKSNQESLKTQITTLEKDLEKARSKNIEINSSSSTRLKSLTIDNKKLQSSLDTLTQESKQQQLQLKATEQALETVQSELNTIKAKIEAEAEAEAVAKVEAEVSKAAEEETTDTIYHIVEPGQSLSNIARKYYDDINQWQKILDANGIDNPDIIQPGQSLLIPKL